MGTPHKHAEVIKAWADGAEIQVRGDTRDTWETVDGSPSWVDFLQFRVKPETKKYRVAMFNNGVHVTDSQEIANRWEHNTRFVRWLTDWVEYEV